jgi:dihydrolipoamide dehydrogenase
MLAHVASHQGMVAAQNALGHETFMHYHAVPAVIFTSPEIATVGLTEEEALERKLPYQLGTFPFAALGKAQASLHTEGFAQIMINTQTREILGACIVGHEASSMIGQMALAIQNELTVDCLIDTIHAHPTMTEAWLEAALLAINSPIHFPPKRTQKG